MSQSNSPIKRRLSKQIMVGKVPVGGDAPISVQTMTNTRTTDVAATVAQIQAAARAGADIVRVSVPDMDAAHAKHAAMGCICFENPGMGIYFIEDPDGYWIEIVPEK